MSSFFPAPAPRLPPFSSLLVKGPYHPSAPIHLALSHTSQSPNSLSLVLSPSQDAITVALHDGWLARNSGAASVVAVSSRVKMFYPPSPAHLCALLSMFQVPRPSDKGGGDWLTAKTALPTPPSIVILHEPSAYFLPRVDANPDSHQWTVSSYMTLITRTITLLTSLSRSSDDTETSITSIAFTVFDSQLDRLKLPILKQPAHHFYQPQEQSSPRLESTATFAQKYFQWMAIFEHEPAPLESSQVEDSPKHCQMSLHRIDDATVDVLRWRWIERINTRDEEGEGEGMQFIFEE